MKVVDVISASWSLCTSKVEFPNLLGQGTARVLLLEAQLNFPSGHPSVPFRKKLF